MFPLLSPHKDSSQLAPQFRPHLIIQNGSQHLFCIFPHTPSLFPLLSLCQHYSQFHPCFDSCFTVLDEPNHLFSLLPLLTFFIKTSNNIHASNLTSSSSISL